MNTNSKIQVAKAFQHLDPHHNLSDDITGGNFHRIGYKGKVWKLMTGGETYSFIRSDDGSPLPNLDVVIVGINPATSRVYYAGVYQEDAVNPPTCASLKGDVPDPGVPIPQHKTCNGCSHDRWGPNRTGKECKEHKRVAVLLLPTMKTRPALPKALIEPVFFKVPPASLKVWKAYTDYLQAQGAPFQSVITRISFNPDKQFEMVFSYFKSLTDKDAELVLPLLADSATKNILGSMVEYKQLPPIDVTPAEDTGLSAAFGQQSTASVESTAIVKRGPGRPKKVAAPADVTEVLAEGATVISVAAVGGGGSSEQEEEKEEVSTFEEAQDSELDSMMKDVLGKVSKMM